MKYSIIVIFALLISISYGKTVRYDDHHVYKIKVETDDELKVFQALEESADGITFLDDPNIHQPFHILVAPDKVAYILKLLRTLKIENRIQSYNFQK